MVGPGVCWREEPSENTGIPRLSRRSFFLCCGGMLAFGLNSLGQQGSPGSAVLIFEHGVPMTQVTVDGLGPFTFVVDTGTSNEVVLSKALARRLDLPSTGQKRLTDLSSAKDRLLDSVLLDSLTVAGIEFLAIPALVNELPSAQFPYDGILGFKLFHDKLLTLDFLRGRILLKNESLSPGGDPSILSFRMPQGVPMVTLMIDGQPVETSVDSGGQGLTIPDSLAQTVKLSGKPKVIATAKTPGEHVHCARRHPEWLGPIGSVPFRQTFCRDHICTPGGQYRCDRSPRFCGYLRPAQRLGEIRVGQKNSSSRTIHGLAGTWHGAWGCAVRRDYAYPQLMTAACAKSSQIWKFNSPIPTAALTLAETATR